MAKLVDFADLGLIKTPDQTETYIPVSHQQLVTRIKEAGTKHYNTAPFEEKLEVNHRGQQMFGSMTFHHGGSLSNGSGMNRSIGFRNSYDKTLPIGVCGGASVFVCSNLMFTGDIIKMRKHTQNVEEDLDLLIQKLFDDVDRRYDQSVKDKLTMEQIYFSDTDAGNYLGQLFVNQGVLNGAQLKKATDEWFNSSAFTERTAWSAYNACTEALKTAHPMNALEKYTKLHTFTKDYSIDPYLHMLKEDDLPF
tara:strand:+ start:143 stop:892 length:750 start_codon:yes stop_codon:yes gene_type:complete